MDADGTIIPDYGAWLAWWVGLGGTGAHRFSCVDAIGRECRCVADFQRARAEETFPIRLTPPDDVANRLAEVRASLASLADGLAALEAASGSAIGAGDLLAALGERIELSAHGWAAGARDTAAAGA